ncbi:MAG: hypothetical protein WC734_03135 [Patescibacteria group bacterium]|jgi:hypothetical protein
MPENQNKPAAVPKPWSMETFNAYLRRTSRTPLLLLVVALVLVTALIVFNRNDAVFLTMTTNGLPYLIVALVLYMVYRRNEYRRLFWIAYSQYRGWTYLPYGQPDVESAMMFHQGNYRVMTDVVNGRILNHPMTLCNYKFRIGYGKNAKIYSYTVVMVTFTGKFPHVYVNRTDMGYGMSFGRALPLPTEVAKLFKIYTPPEYEIEALAIFDPQILEHLLDLKYNYDMELIDQKLYVFMPQMINTKEALEQKLNQAEALLEHMIPQLDRTSYQPIPNTPDKLGNK